MSIELLGMGHWMFVEIPGTGVGNHTSSFGLMLASSRIEQEWRGHRSWSGISSFPGWIG
jgi:hypothetical protein